MRTDTQLDGRPENGQLDGHANEEQQGLGKRNALLLVDLVTDFDFEDGEKLSRETLAMIANVGELSRRARAAGSPIIYVNDNFRRWNDGFSDLVERVKTDSPAGGEVLEHIEPQDDDYYVLKPQRSGFYATPLGILLLSMEISNLVIAGITTDICVLFTAHDAFMRGYNVCVPQDCSAAVERSHHREAIRFLQRVAQVDVRSCKDVHFADHGDRRLEETLSYRHQISKLRGQSPVFGPDLVIA